MDQIIDQTVADFQLQLDQSIQEFFKDADELQKEGLSSEEILAVLAGLSIADYWLQDLQMQNAIDTYLRATGFLLDDMFKFGRITEVQLLALQSLQESSILNYSTRLGEEVRLGFSEGISQGLRGQSLRDSIASKLSVSPRQVEGIVSTTLATYSRSVNNLMAESLPEETLFYFDNPIDDKTRPICRVMVAAGGMTRSEVENKFPGALTDGGGINCRGSWVTKSMDKSIVGKAKSEVSGNQKKYSKAKTLLEYSRESSKT